MDIEIINNDSTVISSFDTIAFLPAIISHFHEGDSVTFRMFKGLFVGFGMFLTIKENSFNALFEIKADDYAMFKLNESDTVLYSGLIVPTITQELTLTKPPEF